MFIELVTPPDLEAVDLALVKAHARIATSTDDAYVTSLIPVARGLVEAALGWSMLTQTWRLWLDAWPGQELPWFDGVREGPDVTAFGARALTLPWAPPLQSVTHVKTYDDADVATTVDAASYFEDTVVGRLIIRSGYATPRGTRAVRSLEVQYVVGYEAAADLPAAIRHAMLVTVAALYEHRGEAGETPTLPDGARHLLAPYALRWFG